MAGIKEAVKTLEDAASAASRAQTAAERLKARVAELAALEPAREAKGLNDLLAEIVPQLASIGGSLQEAAVLVDRELMAAREQTPNRPGI